MPKCAVLRNAGAGRSRAWCVWLVSVSMRALGSLPVVGTLRVWGAVLMLGAAYGASAQEICDNGVDDDGNGAIDLNDAGCPCSTNLGNVPSFIPNPSFEETMCCPYGFNLPGGAPWFNCAQGWNQATVPTSDLFHSCGLFPDMLPLPPPDGEACVGLRMVDGWQEYVGACLTIAGPDNLLQAGVEYTLSFHAAGTSLRLVPPDIGSIGAFYADPIPISLYGRTNCVPFPVSTVGCPVPNGWTELASMAYQANGEWDHLSFTFTPTEDIWTVMLGTGCTLPASFVGAEGSELYAPYLMLDDLHLTEAVDQVLLPVQVSGHPCTNDVRVSAYPPAIATGYQWYRDGVALVGQTTTTVEVSALALGEATYTFAVDHGGECLMGSAMVAVPLPLTIAMELVPASGCVPTTVAFADLTGVGAVASDWTFGDGAVGQGASVAHTYTMPGVYDVGLTVTNAFGCTYDTLLVGAVVVHADPVASITVSPDPTDVDNTVLTLSGAGSSGDILSWWWDLGDVPPHTGNAASWEVPFPAVPGTYPISLVVITSAGCVDTVFSVVTITQAGTFEMPNVFSPNGDHHNDRFIPIGLVAGTGRLDVYNRWGQLVFTTNALAVGWDGRVDGIEAPAGTYYYILTPLEGTQEPLTGHITLLR